MGRARPADPAAAADDHVVTQPIDGALHLPALHVPQQMSFDERLEHGLSV